MPKSFTDYRGHGFWASDAILETWLAALADVVPADAPRWLRDAEQIWHEHAGVGFTGCVDARLGAIVTTPEKAQVVLDLAAAALNYLRQISDGTSYLPAKWLNDRHVSGLMDWSSTNIRLGYVEQVAEAFLRLVRGDLETTATTSPVLPYNDIKPSGP